MKLLAVSALFTTAAVAFPSADVGKAPGEDWRLIRFSDEMKPVWLSPDTIMELPLQDVGFIDVTDSDPAAFYKRRNETFPARSEFRGLNDFETIMQYASHSNFLANADTFAAFPDRLHNSNNGLAAAQWVHDMATRYAQPCGSRANVRFFEHSWIQPSVIARIEGTSSPSEVVVWGAHEDSISSGSTAPGYDDDGSGSMTILEGLKAVCESGVTFSKTIEFQWYAAEEVGLRGSSAIASDYASRNVNVVSMLQHDMTCYNPNGNNNNVLSVIDDNTSPTMNAFMRDVISEYTGAHVTERGSRCGYGCSDHSSFTRAGYPASFTFEKPFGSHNPNIHTVRDVKSQCDTDFMWEFEKMGIGYLVEMAA